jgi:Fur family ferric uptake transcriptional regulator
MAERKTRQKEMILDAVQETTAHPTADEIFAIVREKLPHISLGTVYRNLEKLAAAGDIQVVEKGTAQRHYDGNTSHHLHIRCRSCGKVRDVMDECAVPQMQHLRGRKLGGFLVDTCEIGLVGRCSNCLREAELKGN